VLVIALEDVREGVTETELRRPEETIVVSFPRQTGFHLG
jgi:hypothetical protein